MCGCLFGTLRRQRILMTAPEIGAGGALNVLCQCLAVGIARCRRATWMTADPQL